MRWLGVLVVMAGVVWGAEPQRGKVSVAGRDAEYLFAPVTVAAPLAVVLAPGGDPVFAALMSRNWNLLAPQTALSGDWGVKALEAMVAEASKNQQVLTDRVYLVASGDFAWVAFYAASRTPGTFAATLAAGGSPKPAIDSNRLFGGNTVNTPVYWAAPQVSNREMMGVLRSRLDAAGFRYEVMGSLEDGLARLAQRQGEAFPATADCETGNPVFGRSFWVEITRLDAAKRNDALLSTRVSPGSGASLGIGPFGYDPGAAGPGVVVGWLPDGYKGPLQRDDRIVAVDGKAVENAMEYMRLMDEFRDEKAVVAMVHRGKDRKRIETKVTLPKREETFTGRVQGQYLADSREILLISRGAGALRIHVPPQWAGATVNWNGEVVGKAVKEGCWSLGMGGLQGCE